MNSYYNRYAKNWQYVDDVYNGAGTVKSPERAKAYLKPIPSEVGKEDLYQQRLGLTHFENAFRPVVDAAVGIMQKCPAKVRFGVESDEESPPEVRELDIYGNAQNDGLAGLKRRLNHQQTLYGRCGLLLDVDTDLDGLHPRFLIHEYPATQILDGESGKWYLLDESRQRFDADKKDWADEKRWRVLGLDAGGVYYSYPLVGTAEEVEKAWQEFNLSAPPGSWEENGIVMSSYPNFKGRFCNKIPFTVCNAKSIGFDNWEIPPYIDVAYAVVDAYNADSFYRKAIVNHATPTLVLKNVALAKDAKGNELPITLGGTLQINNNNHGNGEAVIDLVQASSAGLTALKEARDSTLDVLKRISIQDLLDGAGANSSGDAIQLRMIAGTATITDIDLAGEKAIEEQLCFAAYWAGATWAEVGERISYEIDTSYSKTDFSLGEVTSLMVANAAQKLLSRQALYELIRQKANCIPDWLDNVAQFEAVEEVL